MGRFHISILSTVVSSLPPLPWFAGKPFIPHHIHSSLPAWGIAKGNSTSPHGGKSSRWWESCDWNLWDGSQAHFPLKTDISRGKGRQSWQGKYGSQSGGKRSESGEGHGTHKFCEGSWTSWSQRRSPTERRTSTSRRRSSSSRCSRCEDDPTSYARAGRGEDARRARRTSGEGYEAQDANGTWRAWHERTW